MKRSFRIRELASKAGVSVRTIRYYIQEGLLPAPERKGRYTTYTDEHLDRLRLISGLKDAFLPLDEIRVRLEGLSHARVRELLASAKAEDPLVMREETTPFVMRSASEIMGTGLMPLSAEMGEADAIPDVRTDSAKEYVRRLLEDRPQPTALAGEGTRLLRAPSGSSTEWERHEVAEGVEIHVRQPMDHKTRKRTSRLLALAKDIFRE